MAGSGDSIGGGGDSTPYYQKAVIPGVGAAGVQLNNTYGEMKHILGSDGGLDWQFARVWDHGLVIFFEDTNNNGYFDDNDKGRVISAMGWDRTANDTYLGTTTEGFGIQTTSRDEVINVYGAPDYSHESRGQVVM